MNNSEDKIIRVEGFDYGFDSFACKECEGKCCVGESGYIWVTSEEIKKISEFLKLNENEFRQNYLNKVKYKFSIKEVLIGGSYECIFFDDKEKKCQIYEVRPKQCKTFPFWDYFKTHEKEVREECPGIV